MIGWLAGCFKAVMVDGLLELLNVSPDDAPKKYRKGCWWIYGIVGALIVALIVITVIYG